MAFSQIWRLAFVAMIFVAPFSERSWAISLIRDAEIETYVSNLSDPVFSAAGLDPSSIDIYLVRDPRLNAFVAGGQNLFLHTGLLTRSETPGQLQGVIAHETGHIAGGHLSRTGQAIANAQVETLIGAILGAAAAVAGAPQVGTALLAGGATVAQRGVLSFSRRQEQSADQAAVTYLTSVGRSPEGLLEFMEILENDNLRIVSEGDAYLRTHPLTRDRINFMEHALERSRYRGQAPDPEELHEHRRMVAKLDGFLGEPQSVLTAYTGDSVYDRYARAIALYRIPDLDAALELIDQLVAEFPDDPYFWELRGQVLFENGRATEAVADYEKSVELLPDSALLQIGLARAYLEQGNDEDRLRARDALKDAVRLEPGNAGAWRLLGIAEGQLGNVGKADLALTEHAVLTRNRRDATLYVRRAEQQISEGDQDWFRLQDLKRAIAEMEEPGRR